MSARERLEGKVFGDFTVLNYIGNKKYIVQCNICGEKKELYGCNIKRNMGVTCSIDNVQTDLTGQHIGDWFVQEYIGNKRYRCRCSCGKIKDVLKANLINGSSKSCGHDKNTYGDLTGKQFGEWIVLEKVEYKWKCKCSCGKIGYNMAKDLVSGKTKSCGHSYFTNKEMLIGETFGHWRVLEYIGDQKCKCICDCKDKTIRNIRIADLRNGATTSCGCDKRNKAKQTLLNKYGEVAPNKINDTRTIKQIQAIENRDNLLNFIEALGHKPTSIELAKELGIKLHRTLTLIHLYKLDDYIITNPKESETEKQLYKFICSIYNGNVEHNNRTVLNGRELDIYIPEKKIALEFNGFYWHSTLFKDPKYHQQKTIDCAKQGIRLIHIFEHEYNHNEYKIKSFIKDILNEHKQKIYARDTVVKEIDTSIAKDFCEKYHLQGWSNSKIAFGCYKDDELLSVMTFSKPRFNSNYEYEIIRYCIKDNITVVGGAQKLFSHFINEYNPQSVLTYSDISKFTGNIYTKLGFNVLEITQPNYVWVKSDSQETFNRYQTQKHKLIEKGLGTEDQTEDDIMYNMDCLKVYDSGNLKLEWNNGRS